VKQKTPKPSLLPHESAAILASGYRGPLDVWRRPPPSLRPGYIVGIDLGLLTAIATDGNLCAFHVAGTANPPQYVLGHLKHFTGAFPLERPTPRPKKAPTKRKTLTTSQRDAIIAAMLA
jgi:hypothetical protein